MLFAKSKWLRPCLLALCLASPVLTSAQTYPERSVRLIVPYPAGTSNEIFARVFAQHLSNKWETPVVVEPLPGAGGVVGSKAIVSANPDGYTLGWISSPHAINAAVYKELPYDSIKDFRPIVNLASTPMVFVVSASSEFDSLGKLLEAAKAKPAALNFGSNGNGSSSHLASALLSNTSGAEFTHAPYKSTGQLTTDLVSQRIDFAAVGLATAASLVEAGKLRALAVTGAERAETLPDTPTVAETVPGYRATAWMGLVAPAGTPDAIIKKVNEDAAQVAQEPEVLQQMKTMGLSPDPLDQKAFLERIQHDIEMWQKVVTEAGIEQR